MYGLVHFRAYVLDRAGPERRGLARAQFRFGMHRHVSARVHMWPRKVTTSDTDRLLRKILELPQCHRYSSFCTR